MPEVFREAALRSYLLSFSKYEVAETVRQCARRQHVNFDAEQFVQFPAHGPEVQFIEHPSQHPIAHTREAFSRLLDREAGQEDSRTSSHVLDALSVSQYAPATGPARCVAERVAWKIRSRNTLVETMRYARPEKQVPNIE